MQIENSKIKCTHCGSETKLYIWKDGTEIIKCLKCSWEKRFDLIK